MAIFDFKPKIWLTDDLNNYLRSNSLIMGDINFAATSRTQVLTHYVCSCDQAKLPLPICDWPRRLRQSVESGAPQAEEALRHEGNVQSAHNLQTLSQLCDE